MNVNNQYYLFPNEKPAMYSESSIMPDNQIPKWVHKGKYKIEEDAYYTDPAIAEQCYRYVLDILEEVNIDIDTYTCIEPSAGRGSFYNLLPENKIGMDIFPQSPQIKKMNFFDFTPEKGRKYIAIGNPPFGVRAWMALAFINRCSDFCDIVGFILPMYFASNGKGSAKSRVKNMNLIFSKELPPDIFHKPDGAVVGINTVFQIWAKEGLSNKSISGKIPIHRIKEFVDVYTVCTSPARRCGLDKIDLYDYFIQSTYYRTPKIVSSFDQVQYGSGYGIIIKKKKPQIEQILKQIDWDEHALRATNHCKHLGMYSIYSGLYTGGLLH